MQQSLRKAILTAVILACNPGLGGCRDLTQLRDLYANVMRDSRFGELSVGRQWQDVGSISRCDGQNIV